MTVTVSRRRGCRRPSLASAVLVFDDPPQALPCGGQVVFELADSARGGGGLDDEGVAFGDESTVDGLEVADSGDQLEPVWPFDLGAEFEAQALREFVAFGAEPADLLAGDGEVGSQADWGGSRRV